jgi:hypothetical protein
VLGQARLPVRREISLLGDGVDVVRERERHDVGLQPSMTERACFPEPPCDWLIVSFCPAFFASHAFVKPR